MSKQRRLVGIIGSVIFIAFFGWLMLLTLKEDCANLSQAECRFLGGTAIASMLGGALLLETLIARKKARGEWRARAQDLRSNGPSVPASWLWYRSVARVVLVSLLSSLPLIAKGAFVLAVSGAATGLCLDLLMRYIMNWLPPVEEDSEN